MSNRKEYITDRYRKLRLECMLKINPFIVCECCGLPYWEYLNIDHIISNKKVIKKTYRMYLDIISGLEDMSNLQLLCSYCNLNKDKRKKCELDHTYKSWDI